MITKYPRSKLVELTFRQPPCWPLVGGGETPARTPVSPQHGVALSLVACHPTRSRCACSAAHFLCLGGLEQRLKVFGAGVRRDFDDEALARVVSLNLLEDPGEVKVECVSGGGFGERWVGGGGGSRFRVGAGARMGAKARYLRDWAWSTGSGGG